MGLCAFNILTLLFLIAHLNQGQRVNLPADVKPPKKSDGRVRLDAANSSGLPPAPEPPKDNGSVILMTQERDARLLDGQDD